MEKVIHRADSRGYFDHGWLKTHHTFSFGNYYNPNRVHFGKLRVLNDDFVAPGQGFGTHPHDNMEIVSIPLKGTLTHRDNKGHEEVIKPDNIQVMSAGNGIWHSEYNHSEKDIVNFLQIWVLPDGKRYETRYEKMSFDSSERKNRFQIMVAPKQHNGSLWLNQDTFFSLADIDEGRSVKYSVHTKGNGIYVFVTEGKIEASEEKLGRRDGFGIWEVENIEIEAVSKAEILLIEVPMS